LPGSMQRAVTALSEDDRMIRPPDPLTGPRLAGAAGNGPGSGTSGGRVKSTRPVT
jgi:hypothetical protein